MAHYAFLDDNNIVVEVITGKDENEILDGLTPEEWYSDFRNMRCVRTSYNHNIRGVFAAVGYSYNEAEDIFVMPQPFPSWIRNGSIWEAPVALPDTDKPVKWNETIQNWEINDSEIV